MRSTLATKVWQVKQPEDGGEAGAATINTGTVMKWFENRCFGFITPDDGGVAVHAHRTQLIGTEELQLGDTVSNQTEYEHEKRKKRTKFKAFCCIVTTSQPGTRSSYRNREWTEPDGPQSGKLFYQSLNPHVRVKRFPRCKLSS